jgi:hypothetical protein
VTASGELLTAVINKGILNKPIECFFSAEGARVEKAFDEGDKAVGKMIIFVGLASAVTLGALFLAGMLNGIAG